MPARNVEKSYVQNGYYHIYNRGVEKRTIFQDEEDYGVMRSYLKEYLEPKDKEALRRRLADEATPSKEKQKILKILSLNNFHETISLLAYCLMPNHFHFLVKQTEETAIDVFMNSLCTRYTMYFNRKYKRVGGLYQDVYKAVLIEIEEQLLHVSRYIHRNPLALQGDPLITSSGQPSSYDEYLGRRRTVWVKSEEILSYFSVKNPRLSYETFVSQTDDMEFLAKVAIDSQE